MTVERRKRDFKTQLKTKWADWGFIAVMLAVPLLNLLIFYFGVNINSVLLAFKENIGGETVFSLYNFQRLFKEFASSASVVNEALKNTLIFFFLSFIIITPLSLIFAYFLYKKIYGYKIFRFVFFLPSIISATVLTTLYKQLILPDGVISQLVRLVGGEVPLLEQLGAKVYRGKAGQKFVFQMNEAEKEATRQLQNANLTAAMADPADLLILDEAGSAWELDMVDKALLQKAVLERPAEQECVLTAHAAPQWMLDAADYATEMKCHRHPYQRGISARKGIEY